MTQEQTAAATPARARTRRQPTRKAAAKPAAKPASETVAPTAPAAKQKKAAKARKMRLVRDSFTMPEAEHALIGTLKKRCLAAGVAARKSELLRAAIMGLAALDDPAVVEALQRLEVIKTGRPAKEKK